MIVRLIILILFLFIFQIKLESQDVNLDYKIDASPEMVVMVKQFDQFLERFNYEKDFYGNKIDSVFAKKVSRKDYISILINDQLKSDSAKKYLINDFIDYICNPEKEIFIDKYSDQIIAEAECDILYENKNDKIKLLLVQEKEKGTVKWVINDIEANIFNYNTADKEDVFISPTSHELNFISLQKSLTKENNIESLFYKDFKYDKLSIFMYLIYNDVIVYKNVTKLKFNILIDNYYLIIEEFKRQTLNSGWLISDIIYIQ